MPKEKQKIDILDRESIVEDLYNIIQSASKNNAYCSFAIEGPWGVGKTFILDDLEKKLELEMNEDTYDNRYYVFHYNCWKYDYYEEPAIAIVSAFKDKVDKDLGKNLQSKAKASLEVTKKVINVIAKEFVKNKIGFDLVQLYDDFKKKEESYQKKEQEFDTLFAFNTTLNFVREKIGELANDRTIVIIVDELDRCMPTYAIKILERLHHMFEEIDNVILLIAVDSIQLEQSVREIYGDNVDTEHYLKKFISFRYNIGIGELQASVIEKFEDYFQEFNQVSDVDETITRFLQLSGLDIRTLEKLMEKCKLIHALVCDKKVSNSVLLYEIIYTVLQYIGDKSFGRDLYWIPDINLATYASLDECIGKKMLQFLKEMVENAKWIRTLGNRDSYFIKMNPEAICIGYMDKILSHSKKFYFRDESEDTDYEIDVCNNFSKISNSIN